MKNEIKECKLDHFFGHTVIWPLNQKDPKGVLPQQAPPPPPLPLYTGKLIIQGVLLISTLLSLAIKQFFFKGKDKDMEYMGCKFYINIFGWIFLQENV